MRGQITVFSEQLRKPYLAKPRHQGFSRVLAGTVTAVSVQVAGRPRVIVALPDALEAASVVEWLTASNFEPVYRTSPAAAAAEMQHPFQLLITDAAWGVGTALQSTARTRNALVPTILIGEAIERRATAVNSQTFYMTRPIEKPVLSCFVSMALIDDRPVRRSPRKMVQRFEALVNGLPTGIVNVSAEGLRLEVPREHRGTLPPYFAVRVPLVGVAVIAKRRWMMPVSKNATTTLWCGAVLSHNRASSEERWRAFVDSVPIVGAKTLRVSA